MFQYFFTPESDVPAGCGFSHFDRAHISALICLAALSAIVIMLALRMSEKNRQKLLRVMASAMIVMEILKDFTLAVIGSFSIGYLPLHLCSLAMFICLFAAFHPNNDAAGQLLWSLCFSGGLAALLFPDWTDLPLIHFQSIHSFIYHAMLVQFSLIAVISGQARPRVGKLWKVWAFLAVVATGVYFLNRSLNTNYMFLNHPVPDSPLELCARIPGPFGYLLGFALLVGVILVLLDLPFTIWAHWKNRPRVEK